MSSDNKKWLVTCIHIVTGKVENTTDVRQFEFASINALGTELNIPLVVGRDQKFIAVSDPGKSGKILDIMAIPLSDSQYSKISAFGSYDVDMICDIEIGEEVYANGFAGINLLQEPKASSFFGKISKANTARFVIDAPSIKGLSGSAVTSKNGLVGLMYGDEGSDEAPIAATCVRLNVVKPAIFQ
ncbi:hypothetical protein HHL26_15455 [Sphingobium sp. TB-6]|nr:hypothetical protein [Sphingobium sp. TB-6]